MEITEGGPGEIYASQVGMDSQNMEMIADEPVENQLADMFSLVLNVQTQLLQVGRR